MPRKKKEIEVKTVTKAGQDPDIIYEHHSKAIWRVLARDAGHDDEWITKALKEIEELW